MLPLILEVVNEEYAHFQSGSFACCGEGGFLATCSVIIPKIVLANCTSRS
jgi:hypothetical protein